MSLKEILFEDMKMAMKNKDSLRKNTIQAVRTAVLQEEKDNQISLSEDQVIGVIASQIKKRKAALPDFIKSGRDELISELKTEIEILESYLPEQLSEEEITELVELAIQEIGATSMKDMGKVMQVMTEKVKGRGDSKLISQIVKKLLA
ncbi:MAG: GatB/YqeY domain-containing protein [Vallitaleaceae bacterium]|nr:GatB/YqeY domain-containing protein [Vallitaleaceae bacterium]